MVWVFVLEHNPSDYKKMKFSMQHFCHGLPCTQYIKDIAWLRVCTRAKQLLPSVPGICNRLCMLSVPGTCVADPLESTCFFDLWTYLLSRNIFVFPQTKSWNTAKVLSYIGKVQLVKLKFLIISHEQWCASVISSLRR